MCQGMWLLVKQTREPKLFSSRSKKQHISVTYQLIVAINARNCENILKILILQTSELCQWAGRGALRQFYSETEQR